MTEIHDDGPDEGPAEETAEEPAEETAATGAAPAPATGHPAVDEVLRSLERLEEQPVGEHVDVFERAHEQLRRALAEARDAEPGGGG